MNKHPQSIEEFLAAPYFERQFVSFVDDGDFGPLYLLLPAPTGGQTAVVVAFNLYSIYRLLQRFLRRRRGGVPVTLLPWSWASHLRFPLGPPRLKLLYAGHPADPPTYIPITDFHHFSFEHKVKELVSILTHLGAKQIAVQCTRGRGTETAIALAAAAPQLKVEVVGKDHREEHEGSRMDITVELEGHDNPCLPNNLVWYRHEPTWQMMAEGRSHGLKNCSLSLHYKDDYGINADLKVYAEKAGFDMGDGFQEYTATTWRVEVGF